MYTSGKITVKEKIGYSLGDLAANLIFQTIVTFLTFFYTDVYKIEPGAASRIIFVGGMVGAFFNPVMGIICDRTNTKWGEIQTMDSMDFYTPGHNVYFGILNASV